MIGSYLLLVELRKTDESVPIGRWATPFLGRRSRGIVVTAVFDVFSVAFVIGSVVGVAAGGRFGRC